MALYPIFNGSSTVKQNVVSPSERCNLMKSGGQNLFEVCFGEVSSHDDGCVWVFAVVFIEYM